METCCQFFEGKAIKKVVRVEGEVPLSLQDLFSSGENSLQEFLFFLFFCWGRGMTLEGEYFTTVLLALAMI